MYIIYAERTVSLKYLKIELDTDLKIILLDCQNNYIGHLNIMSSVATNFENQFEHNDYIIILIELTKL